MTQFVGMYQFDLEVTIMPYAHATMTMLRLIACLQQRGRVSNFEAQH